MQIAVLGPLRMVDDGVALELPGRRQRALVCRLAVAANDVVPAATLVEDLWDGAPTPGAASTLQSHVSAVRKVLGTARIASSAGGYRLAVRPDEVDARVVATLAGRARDGARTGAWDRVGELVAEALAHYRGEPYLDAGGALWARGEVSRLVELRLELIEMRIDALLVAGDHAAAVAETEALIADEPLRERSWAQLMVALHRAGRRAEALRAYQRLRHSLGDGLGLEPSPALVALEGAIAVDDPAVAAGLPWATGPTTGRHVVSSGRVPTVGGDPRPSELPPILRDAASTPTVGRAAERRALDDALRELADGRGGTVVVTGEGGIGKTTLVAAATAAAAGVAVLYGRCLADGELYYQPFVDALAGAPSVLPTDVGAELTLLGPRAGADGAERSGDSSVDRYLLFQGVGRVLSAVADVRPLALVIDDLHWADDGTVALARHLVDRVADQPVLLIIAVRAVDLDPDSPAGALLADLHRGRRVTRLDLDGLHADDVAELAARFGTSPAMADRLVALTAGNPYFVAELLRHGWRGPGGSETLPATVADMVRRRAGAAGPDVARVLAGAAVIGPTFDAALVAEVTERAHGDVLDVLDQAIDRGLVVEQEQPGGITRLAFTHALAGTALAGTLSAGRRRVLHRRCALALGRRRAVAPAAIAQHWLGGYEGDDVPLVVEALRLAGEDAMTQLVPTEALAWFDRALDVATEGVLPAADHARLLVGRARALYDLNEPDAGPALREAAAAAAASGDAELLAAAALTGSRGFASSLRPMRVRRAVLLEQAVEAGPSAPTRSRLLADLATELMMVDAARASALAREAIDLAVAAGTEADQLHALKRAAAVGSPLVVDWIWPLLDRAGTLAERLGDRRAAWELAVCTRLLALLRGDRARLDAAAAAVADAGPLNGLARVRFAIALDRARVALIDGRPLDARAAIDELTQVAAEVGLADGVVFRHVYLGAAQRQLGVAGDWQPAGVFESFDAATAVTLVDLGEHAAAAERIDAVLGDRRLDAIPMSNHWLSEVGCWAYVAARLGQTERAADGLAALEPHAHRTDELVGPASHVVGLCAALVVPTAAPAWLDRAAAQATEQRLGFAGALIDLDRADLALAAGRADVAHRLAGDALAVAGERRYGGLARRARALLGDPAVEPPTATCEGVPR